MPRESRSGSWIGSPSNRATRRCSSEGERPLAELLAAVRDVNGNAEAFARTAKTIATTSEFNLILMTEKPAVMKAAVAAAGFKRPLLYAATAGNLAEMGALAKEAGLPLAATSRRYALYGPCQPVARTAE